VRSPPRFIDSKGSGTVLSLALVAIISALLFVMINLTNRIIDQARLDALAENAAIAGADSLRGLAAGAPCDVARELVLSGSARIISCSTNSTDLLIQLERNGFNSKARAGEASFEEK
jgi:secretion/DNA translocation related TadE-like protein